VNLDSNIVRVVGMEHGKLFRKGKKGHRLEAASFHLTDRACVCVSVRRMLLPSTQTDLERERETKTMASKTYKCPHEARCN